MRAQVGVRSGKMLRVPVLIHHSDCQRGVDVLTRAFDTAEVTRDEPQVQRYAKPLYCQLGTALCD